MVSISSVLDFIFPPVCPHCRREGAWLCAEAAKEISHLQPIIDPLPISGIAHVYVSGSYDIPVLATLIHALKFSGWSAITPAVDAVTSHIASFLPTHGTLVPVPLHPKRQRERGFNQALLIAKQLSIQTGLPIAPLLQRFRPTAQQAQLSEKERAINISGAFRLERGLKILPACAILVDDVITTGATIAECATVLRAVGIQKILAVGLAKG